MKDTTLSKKVGEKYEPMITLKQGKYGMQFALTPQFQKELYTWVKSQDGTYMNLNVKVWDDKKDEGYPTNNHPDKGSNSYGDSQDIPF